MRCLTTLAPAILGAAAVAGFAACSASSPDAPTGNAAQASSVTPIVLPSTQTCVMLGYTLGCRITSPTVTSCTSPNGEVTLSNRMPESFDWSATFPIDAVLVTAAQSPFENLYVYSPASTGDTGLGSLGGTTVSRIEFCVKAGAGAGQDAGTQDAATQDAAAHDAAHEAGLDAGQVEDAGEAVDSGQPSGKSW